MSIQNRGTWVLCVSGVVILLVFAVFALGIGWPGQPNECTTVTPNTCFCEAYDLADVQNHARGIRQPVNTLFNLYALFTAGLIALFVSKDRRKFGAQGSAVLIRSNTWVPELYIFAVLFLGLGSMWFHASLTQWGGRFDGMSMYIFTAFLVFYSIRRMWNNAAFFWIGYIATVVLFTGLHNSVPSVVNIMILVLAYLIFEVMIWVRTGKVMNGSTTTVVLWILAVVSMGLATLFWVLSQTGGPMCDPNSLFQPHGLLWHPLAGLMAVFLYFYWRAADDTPRPATP